MKQGKQKINLRVYSDAFVLKNTAVFATKSNDDIPNIVPIHSKHVLSGKNILISDQFMKKTKDNIMANSKAVLSIKNGNNTLNIRGTCKYKTSGFFYWMAVRGVRKYAKQNNSAKKEINLNCKGIVLMKVSEIYNIPGFKNQVEAFHC